MSKKTQDVQAPAQAETTPETTDMPLVETQPTALAGPLSHLLADMPRQYLDIYRAQVEEVQNNLPSKAQFQQLIMDLPEEYDALVDLVKKSMGSHKGILTQEDSTKFPELRLYQGTGSDKNRPIDQIPGQFYLVPMEQVGKTFEGTVIAMWTGALMWEDGSSVPVCSSMDRVMGTTYGECRQCPNRPFAVKGQPNKCSNEVVALMLRKDYSDLVIVRFSKTSEAAGRQLMQYVKRGVEPWARWYTVSADPTVGKDPSKRYFVMKVTPQTGDDAMVPETIWNFCNALHYSVMATYILPMVKSVYVRAEQNAAEDASAFTPQFGSGNGAATTANPNAWGDEEPPTV